MGEAVAGAAVAQPVTELGADLGMLTADRLVANDPVYRFLHDRLGGALTVIFNVALMSLIFFGGAYLNGGLFNSTYGSPNHNSDAAVFFDRTTSLRKILLTALGLLVYFQLPRLVAALFNNLRANSVLSDSRREDMSYEQFLNDIVRKMNLKLWPILGVMTVVGFWVHRFFSYNAAKRPLWLEIAALAAYALAYYVFIPTLAKLWIVILSTNRLFRTFYVRVNPLHPDGAGGFGPVGRMLSTYALIFAVFGLLIAAGMLSSYYREGQLFRRTETWMLLVGYTSLPALLWSWLWVPHKAMQEARDRKLLVLAEAFLRGTLQHDAGRASDALSLKESTEWLSELKKQYELLMDSYPTWPIRFWQVNRLAALMSAPLITTILPHIVSAIGALGSKR